MDKKERFERYKYLTGLSSWEIASYLDKDNLVVVNDGPSGLRKPKCNDFAHQEEVIQTVCLPTPSSLAASFDKKLCYRNGELLAKECLHHNTNILLAPGVNIKDYVLCGRNFEYFSEDPFLGGILASNYINGLEDNNVGTCVKHYACNSQEFARTINSSEMSLRALNEIYLRIFKYIFKHSNPTSVMTSYNKINDEYVNESKYLIQDKLRKEYNYQGLIMSDWCAVSNKWKGIEVGLNIEMPLTRMSNEYIDRGYNVYFKDEDLINRDKETYNALKKFKNKKTLDNLDLDKLHLDAIEIASKTMVLVKNKDNYLPLNNKDNVLVLGYFANHNRFVGGGSGWVNAYKPKTFIDTLKENNVNFDFLECYDEDNILINEESLKEYKNKYDKVILFLGQYQKDESEGYDRITIDLDDNQIKVLNLVKENFDNFSSVIVTGSVVNLKEVYKKSSSILITYLAGEGQNEAIYNNLFGLNNPSGRLPESWISSLDQNPINKEYLRRDMYYTYHYDDIYVGYRYYDLYNNDFILPFGYGLSYSNFNYSNYEYILKENELEISLDIENISDRDAEEVIQVYAGKKDSNIYRPIKELKAFEKIKVNKKEKERITIHLDLDDLKSYRDAIDSFDLEEGNYEIYVALNTKDILDTHVINLKGSTFEKIEKPKELVKRTIENKYTVDSPFGLFFDNKIFKDYVNENNLPIDLEDFENKKWYLESRTLRGIINDNEYKLTFEELEALINYMNKFDRDIDKHINFDEYVEKHTKVRK